MQVELYDVCAALGLHPMHWIHGAPKILLLDGLSEKHVCVWKENGNLTSIRYLFTSTAHLRMATNVHFSCLTFRPAQRILVIRLIKELWARQNLTVFLSMRASYSVHARLQKKNLIRIETLRKKMDLDATKRTGFGLIKIRALNVLSANGGKRSL